jgi:hypothetical protein
MSSVNLGGREVPVFEPALSLGVEGVGRPDGEALLVRPTSIYPPALVARDLTAISHLRVLTDVCVEASLEAAQLIDALLHGEPVVATSPEGGVNGAANRPAPPRPLTIWHRSTTTWVPISAAG